MQPIRLFLWSCCLAGAVFSWSGNVCSKLRIKSEWRWGCRYRTRKECLNWGYISYDVQDTEYFCCNGWKHTGNQVCDKAICPYDCGGSSKGTCTKPGACQCKPGYTGTYCTSEAACSHTKPCYPGNCTEDVCKCSNGFSPQNSGTTTDCLQYPEDNAYYPSIEQSTVEVGYQLKKMIPYDVTFDSRMSRGNVETFWTNRKDVNVMNFTFRSIFSPSTLNFPDRPSYITRHAFGITAAEIRVKLTDHQNSEKYSETMVCSGVTMDNPVQNLPYLCVANISNFNTEFQSRDTFSVTFWVENGGNRILDVVGTKQYYKGKSTTRRIYLKFDTETPYHCSERKECNFPSSIMAVHNDITKQLIQISWGGWTDQLSKVAKYVLEVFKLVKAENDTLRQPFTELIPSPVQITKREFYETTYKETHYFIYRPSEPGVYYFKLGINDRANNSIYAKRFVIYDPDSSVTSDKSNPLYATSGNSMTNYEWQNNNSRIFSFSWKNHFFNELHEKGNFLAHIRLSSASNDATEDNYEYKKILEKYNDTEGIRSINAIPNERGIIKYDIAHAIGTNISKSPTYQNTSYMNSSITITLSETLQDGNCVSVWVKAYDILGNSKEEKVVLHYDSSHPTVDSIELQKNTGNGDLDFTSSIRIVGAMDQHSGVKRIKFRFLAQSTQSVISQEHWFYNPKRDKSYCNTNPCDSNLATGEMFGRTIDFQFSNCETMNVSDISSENVTMEMDIYNSAGIYLSRNIEISNLTSLNGVNYQLGPVNIRIADTFNDSLKLMWDQTPSCLNIIGFQFINSKGNGTVIANVTFDTLQDWVLLHNVTAGESYCITLYTLYGDDENNPVKSEPSTFQFSRFESIVKAEEMSETANSAAKVSDMLEIIIPVATAYLLWYL